MKKKLQCVFARMHGDKHAAFANAQVNKELLVLAVTDLCIDYNTNVLANLPSTGFGNADACKAN